MRRALACFALLALTFSCSEEAPPLTELIVVVDSDLRVPAELDGIAVNADGPAEMKHEASAVLGDDEPPLPRTLTFVHRSGPLGPLSIEVDGKLGDDTVVLRTAEVSFVEGRSLVLPLHLVRRCRDVMCKSGQTCTERGCESAELDEDELDEWDGHKPELMDAGWVEEDAGMRDAGRMDAAVSDAGAPREAGADACVPRAETCNGRDDNCNGRVDDGFNLQTDENNCGMCGIRCNAARGEMCCTGVCRATTVCR